MDQHDAFQSEIEEPLSVQIEKQPSTRKYIICSWFQRLITLDDIPNQKHYRPVFIIFMSILHVSMYFLTFIKTGWGDRDFESILFDLFKFFLPCMRPTSRNIRNHIVTCHRSMRNETCYYDDVLKYMCFSFTYPHQIWRMVTVNLLHLGWLHLVSNLLVQLVQGIPLERKYGSIRVAIVYWLSDLGASLSIMGEHRKIPGVGASGSLYGLMLFFIMDRLIAIQTNTNRRLFIIIQLVLLLLPHIIASIPLVIKYEVVHSAHVGGGLVGFLLAVGMFGCPWPWNNEHCICRILCRRTAFIVLILYYIITFTIFFTTDAPIVDSILYDSQRYNRLEYGRIHLIVTKEHNASKVKN